MSIDTTNPRVRAKGNDYKVMVGDRWYLVEQDDRTSPPTWWAYTDLTATGGGERIGQTGDPLSGNAAACAGYRSAEELISVLLTEVTP